MNAFHRRQVDHHAAVDRRAPGDIVAAAAHGDLELLLARQFDRVDDVGDTAAPGDQRRPLVDQPVMDFSGILVARIGRLEEHPREGLAEFADRVAQRCCRIHARPPRQSSSYRRAGHRRGAW